MDDKLIGLLLAICSSLLIGVSFVITKLGLQRCTSENGCASDSHRYLRNPIWWVGLTVMVAGELLNFIGYTFAPAILITPLGALSVIIGAVLASIFLKERLGASGIIGCLLSLIGAVIIVLHSPEDPTVESVDRLVSYMLQPGFIAYFVLVILVTAGLIYKAVPRWGKTRPIVYVTICSLVGSMTIMSIKAFGIAVKLTISGNNQFTQASTYVFGFMCVVFILIQMHYFNKALDNFSTNVVNPIYFVFFTTATIVASAIMYRGWHTADAVNTVTMVCGFLIIFAGVYLLNSVAKQQKQHHQQQSISAVSGTEQIGRSTAAIGNGLISSASSRSLVGITTTAPVVTLTHITHQQQRNGVIDEEKWIKDLDMESLKVPSRHHVRPLEKVTHRCTRQRACSLP